MKKTKLFSLILLGLLCSAGAWADTQGFIYASGYENGKGTWSGSATISSQPTIKRTGSKSISAEYTGSTSAKNATQNTGNSESASKSKYCHIIGWAKAAEGTATTVQIGFNSSKKSDPTTISASTWTQISYKGNDITPSTIIIYKGGAKTDAYFDDIVAYWSESSTTDVTAPSSATGASATASTISWTNGEDTGTGYTGIQNTLIWKQTNGSANDLTLNNQGIYSLIETEGPSTDQSGNWTLLSATVAADAMSFSGTFTAGEYAIVHRDLAYNYSSPTYVTVAGANPVLSTSNSSPAGGATGVAVSGSGYLKFSKSLSSTIDGSKISISPNENGEALSSIARDGTDDTKVNFSWSGLMKETDYTISVAANAVSDGTNGNTAASLSFTTVAKTTLTAAWSDAAPSYTIGGNASENLPTFSVSGGGTLGEDYSVEYSSNSEIVTLTDGNGAISAINTSAAASAIVTATVTLSNSADYSIATTAYNCTITVAAAPTPSPTSYTTTYVDVKDFTVSNSEVTSQTSVSGLTYSFGTGGKWNLGNQSHTENGVSYTKKLTAGSNPTANVNGVDEAVGENKNYHIPDKGGYIKFEPTVNATLTLVSNYGGNKSEDIVVGTSDATCSHTENAKTSSNWVTYINMTAGNTYYVYWRGSKISILGFVFTPNTPTIKSYGWASLCLDYPALVPTGATAYWAEEASSTAGTITLKEIAAGSVIPAKTGVVVKGTANASYTFAYSSTTPETVSGNLFRGLTVAKDTTYNTAYVLAGGAENYCSFKLYRNGAEATTDVTLGANKAYLPAGNIAASPERIRFVIEEENNATAVENIEATDETIKFIQDGKLYIKRNNIVYDAMGRVVR